MTVFCCLSNLDILFANKLKDLLSPMTLYCFYSSPDKLLGGHRLVKVSCGASSIGMRLHVPSSETDPCSLGRASCLARCSAFQGGSGRMTWASRQASTPYVYQSIEVILFG